MVREEQDHRTLNAYVHAYKDKMMLKNVEDGGPKNTSDYLNLEDPRKVPDFPNYDEHAISRNYHFKNHLNNSLDNIHREKSKKSKKGDLFCKRVDFSVIDYQSYHEAIMDFGKATGLDPK